jgi:hypothetical protein
VLVAYGVPAQPERGRVLRRFAQAAGATCAAAVGLAMAGSIKGELRQPELAARPRSILAGGKVASAPTGTPARRRAACVPAQPDEGALSKDKTLSEGRAFIYPEAHALEAIRRA